MFKFPKLNIPKQLFASNPFQRPNPVQPAPQPVNPMGVSGRSMMSAFGQPFARAPQPVRPPFTSAFGQPFARAPQPVQGPSAFAGMFGNGGFGQPISPIPQQPTQTPFLGGFGVGQIMPAQQTPQPTTGLSGLGTLSPEQITQLQNSMGPQTLPTNVDQELAKMSPGGMQQTAQTGPLFEQSPFANNLGYNDTSTQNMMAGPGMGFPAAPVPSGGATGVSAPPTGGLSSLGSA